jgi:hypothetical protein
MTLEGSTALLTVSGAAFINLESCGTPFKPCLLIISSQKAYINREDKEEAFSQAQRNIVSNIVSNG